MTIVRNPDGTVKDIDPRPDLLRLADVTADTSTALNHLQAQMAVATELAEDLGDNGRSGIFRAMSALLDFCSGQGIPRAALYPLQLVAGAIVDADRGVATPAFCADSRGGRPPIPTYEITHRAHRAVIVECCIQQKRLDGVRAFKREGAEEAVRLLRQAGWQSTLSSSQLIQLREEVTARPAGDPIRDEFDRMMESDSARVAPIVYAKVLLGHGWVNRPPAGPKS